MNSCAYCIDLARQLREAREELAEWQRTPGRDIVAERRERAVLICNRLRRAYALTAKQLRPGEIRVLLSLMSRDGKVAKIDDLLIESALHGDETNALPKMVTVRVAYLRRVLEQAGMGGGVVETVVGVGYRITADNLPRVQKWLDEASAT
jgi:DNA-binding response OmpR family regulator